MIKDYLEVKYDLKIDLEKDCFDYPTFEYTETVFTYKKDKNGKLKKCKDGYGIIDHNKTNYDTKYAELNDDSAISIDIH
jgi:hypothetical protein